MVRSTSTVAREGRGTPTWLALLLVAVSISIAAAAVVAVAHRSSDRAAPAGAMPIAADVLPPVLAGLPATVHVSGPEAVDAVTGLHLGDVPVDTAEVADYGGGKIVVWVSWSKEADAPTLVERMTERIAAGDTPFSSPQPDRRTDGGYVTRGNGQVHHYWAQDGGVWWLAADPGLARAALDELTGGAG